MNTMNNHRFLAGLGACAVVAFAATPAFGSCARPAAQTLWHWPTTGSTVASGGVVMALVPFGGAKSTARIEANEHTAKAALTELPHEYEGLRRFRLPALPVGATATVVIHIAYDNKNGHGPHELNLPLALKMGPTEPASKPLKAPKVGPCTLTTLADIKSNPCHKSLLKQACLDSGYTVWRQWQATPPKGAVAWYVTVGKAPSMHERRFVLPLTCGPSISARASFYKLCFHIHALDHSGDRGEATVACPPPQHCMPWDHNCLKVTPDKLADAMHTSATCDQDDTVVGPNETTSADTVQAGDDGASGSDNKPAPDAGCAAGRSGNTSDAPWFMLLAVAFAVAVVRPRQRRRAPSARCQRVR